MAAPPFLRLWEGTVRKIAQKRVEKFDTAQPPLLTSYPCLFRKVQI